MSKASTTAPKGRATRARNEAVGGNRFFGPTMQWVGIVVVALIVMAGIFYFGRDFRSNTGGGHSGAPADGVAAVVHAPTG
ncbi:MAG: hypothetical protein AB8G14_16435 [Ilumatobacter sp.]